MRDMAILRVVSQLFIPFILLFAFYVQFHGDYGPGGGFQAGVILAAGFILFGLIFGLDSLRRVVPTMWVKRGIAVGVLLYGGTGLASLFLGGNFLDYDVLDSHDPVHGRHLGILLVEGGVGITVTSAVLLIYYAFTDRGRPAALREVEEE